MSDQYGGGPAEDDPRDPDRPGPYRGVFGGSTSQPGSGTPDPATPPPDDRPGPYPGTFGNPGAPSGQPRGRTGQPGGPAGQPGGPAGQPGGPAGQPGQPSGPAGQPGSPSGPFGQAGPPTGQPGGPFGQAGGSYGPPNPYSYGPPNQYSYQPGPIAPPKQVSIASVISFALGGLSIVLGLFALTSAGEQIAETLTGQPERTDVVVAAALICGVIYILPAIFIRKGRPWARTMLIVVAAIGILGGITALPAGILGLGLHVAILVLLLQQPTKLWFSHPRR